MSESKKIYLISIVFIVQSLLILQNGLRNNESIFSFLLGLEYNTTFYKFSLWFLGIISISFFFSGTISRYFSGNGIYELYRCKNRLKWIKNLYLNISIKLVGIVILQLLLFTITHYMIYGYINEVFPLLVIYKMLFIYSLTLLCLISFQLLLEILINSEISLLIIGGYIVIAISLADILYNQNSVYLLPLLYILIPNFAMSLRIDVSSSGIFYLPYINALLVVIFLTIVIMFMSMKKLKKKDLY